ncbi:MAG: cupin [Rhodospirillales bacterium]|nr:cupin [Rhodospirillales bacterium]
MAEAGIRNIAEVEWEEFPGHHGGALSKRLSPEARHLDHRISAYQPRAHVEMHAHKVQEQIYHVLEGEGLMRIGEMTRVVRRHDVVFLPGVPHAISNTELADLVFLVTTSPATDN